MIFHLKTVLYELMRSSVANSKASKQASELAVFYMHAATQTQTQTTSALKASALQTERERAKERKRMRVYIWEIHNTTIGVLSIQLVLVEQRKDNVKHTALPVHTAHSTEAHNQTANKCGWKKLTY